MAETPSDAEEETPPREPVEPELQRSRSCDRERRAAAKRKLRFDGSLMRRARASLRASFLRVPGVTVATAVRAERAERGENVGLNDNALKRARSASFKSKPASEGPLVDMRV